MENIFTKKAPAKINLTLDVTGKLENGYHTLSMIMQSIDVCDELSFEKTTDEQIIFTMNKELPDKIPSDKNDIIFFPISSIPFSFILSRQN